MFRGLNNYVSRILHEITKEKNKNETNLSSICLFMVSINPSWADIFLENGLVRLIFDDTGFGLKSLEDLTTGWTIYFDQEQSAIWAVTFLDTESDSVTTESLNTMNSFELQAEKSFTIKDTLNNTNLTLFWKNIEFSEGDTLEVRVTVSLPQNENKSFWNIEVQNASTRYSTFSVDFPSLALQPLGPSKENDMLLVPSHSGSLFRDPIAHTNMDVKNHTDVKGKSSNNEYPGMIGMQFFYYYAEDTRQGLYCFTDDTAGYARRYCFDGDKNRNLLFHFIRHYPEKANTLLNR